MVQFSHPYLTTGKTIASTIHSFVGKMISLLFNTLPRFVIAFFQFIISKSQVPHTEENYFSKV